MHQTTYITGIVRVLCIKRLLIKIRLANSRQGIQPRRVLRGINRRVIALNTIASEFGPFVLMSQGVKDGPCKVSKLRPPR